MIGFCVCCLDGSRSFARLEELWFQGGWDSSSTCLGPVGGRFVQSWPSCKAGAAAPHEIGGLLFCPMNSSMAGLSGPSSERRLRGRPSFCKLRGAVGILLAEQPPQAVTRQVHSCRSNVQTSCEELLSSLPVAARAARLYVERSSSGDSRLVARALPDRRASSL